MVKVVKLDILVVIEHVTDLFAGHPALISSFNAFLPSGFHIETSESSRILVATPALSPSADGELTIQFPPGESPLQQPVFDESIKYINRIKNRFLDDQKHIRNFWTSFRCLGRNRYDHI
ncbi:hypothetical protein M422DRAFT_42473 [Sphaerobolus stellatus SS14]|nr:hypothetical protein M422DRAFT_42473 [Sphaerobolus stellatus SS14]